MNGENLEVQRNASDFWFACVDIDVIRDSSLSLTFRGIYSIICSYASLFVLMMNRRIVKAIGMF